MRYTTKLAPETDIDAKVRNCLSCLRPFTSEWAGERICRKCKSLPSWRMGSAHQETIYPTK